MNLAGARGLVAVALLAGCATGGGSGPSPPHSTDTGATNVIGATYFTPTERMPVPKLGSSTLSGSAVSLADTLGHAVVVLNVWASWCTECRAESRGLASLWTRFKAAGVHFVGIDEQDVGSKARTFVATVGTDYPQLVDRDGGLLAKLTMVPSSGIPSTLVIDKQGRVAARIIGAAAETQLRRLIERVLAEG